MSEESRLAVVTGASSGIGRAFAERLAREGWNLVLVARRGDLLTELGKRLAGEHGIDAHALPADLTRAEELRRVEERIAREASLALLVNNAGFGTVGALAGLDPDREEAQVRLNVIALVRLTRAALPGMIARGKGGVINVSSGGAFQPDPYFATYGATKAFVNSFTEAIHEELRGTGVRVQALCPGFTRTEFQQRAGVDASRIPAAAWMTPEAVVEASLSALRRGQLVCVPGFGNQAVALLTGLLPRAVQRRVAAVVGRRAVG